VPGVEGELPGAADCYRYSLSQPGVSACLSAPRRGRELEENLAVLARPELTPEAAVLLRRQGAAVHQESRRFNALVRQAGRLPAAVDAGELEEALEPPPAACERW
jgi:predicted aldo/keto reductase-like oxidoreductase